MRKFRSKTQAVVELSSAEAELGAAVKTSHEMMSLWKDVGDTGGHVMGDASAAIGTVRRMSLGKVRHLKPVCLRYKRKNRPANCSTTQSKAATTALTCSPRRLTMIVSFQRNTLGGKFGGLCH